MNHISMLIIGFFFLSGPILIGQCITNSETEVEDLTSVQIQIEVNGLSNNELSNTGQGLCNLHIEFEHDNIGDWSVSLASPSGQKIQLIGSPGIYSGTPNTIWDITFIPCNVSSIPDLGFLPTWDSNQSWGGNNHFSGIYYPNDGCLEDFDQGSVNGLWTLFVEDINGIDIGSIKNVELEFCDQSGSLSCRHCTPEGGQFTISQLDLCEGSNRLLTVSDIDFEAYDLDQTIYAYAFIISINDTVITTSEMVDFSLFSPGAYTLVGLTYLQGQDIFLPQAGELSSNFFLKIEGATPSVCASSTSNSLQLLIQKTPQRSILFDTICYGGSYFLIDTSYSATDTYEAVIHLDNGCDSLITLNLFVQAQVQITGPDELDCQNDIIEISLTSVDQSSIEAIRWFKDTSALPQFNDQSNIEVSGAGSYLVIYNHRGCVDTLEHLITSSVDIPIISVEGQNIDCNQNFGQVQVNTSQNLSFEWELNGIPFSTNQMETVNEIGLYTVTATNAAQCMSIMSIQIIVDTFPADVHINPGSLACKDSIQILLAFDQDAVFNWSGINNFTSSEKEPFVGEPGFYTVKIVPSNGCETVRNIEVLDIVRPLQLSFVHDTITCQNTQAQIEISSLVAPIDAMWVGPLGDTVFGTMPNLSLAGLYTLQIVNLQDGCVFDTMYNVISTAAVSITGLNDIELTCTDTAISITPIIEPPTASATWIYPDDRETNEVTLSTNIAGQYILKVVDQISGCKLSDTLEVKNASGVIRPEIQIDTLTCIKDTIILSVRSDLDFRYQWRQSDGTLIRQDTFLSVSSPGYYYLRVIDVGDCQAIFPINVPFDNYLPNLLVTADDSVLSCVNDSPILEANSGFPIEHYEWLYGGNPISNNSTTEATVPGIYQLIVQYSQLCQDQSSFEITGDTEDPNVTIESPERISCNQLFTDLNAYSSQDLNYEWIFDGATISHDSIVSVSRPGVYILLTQNPSQCIRTDTLTILTDTLATPVHAIGGEINCTNSKVEISADTIISNFAYTWTGPNGYTSSSITNLVRELGLYELNVVGTNGCSSKSDFELKENIIFPEILGIGGSLSCRDSTLKIIGRTNDQSNELTWFGPNGYSADIYNPIVDKAGIYVIVARGANGCVSRDSIVVDSNPVYPEVQLKLDTWGCQTDSLKAVAQSSDSLAIYNWSNSNGFNFEGSNAILPSLDVYTLQVEGFDGCITVIDTVIFADTIRPTVSSFTNDLLLCDQTQVVLDGSESSTGPNFSIEWSTNDGIILGDANNSQVLVEGEGKYTLKITNLKNQCSNEENLLLESTINTLSQFEYEKINYGCATNFGGTIHITNVIGGLGSILFSIDNEDFSDVNSFIHLDPGEYVVRVKDSFGCIIESQIHIDDVVFIDISLPQEVSVKLGDTLTINPIINSIFDLDELSYNWQPQVGLECTDCAKTNIIPTQTINYCLTVTNGDLCVETKCVNVSVTKSKDPIFVPDAFSPNGDDTNELLEVFRDFSVDRILSFEIFSRKGHRVYRASDSDLTEKIAWDGNFNGQPMESQVFAYKVNYTLLDGTAASKNGNFTLLR